MSTLPEILAIGSVFWDVVGRAARPMERGADVPGRIIRQPGGVATNIAAALARNGLNVALLGVVGHDPEGDELLAALARMGIDIRYLYRDGHLATDRYIAIEDPDGLLGAVADARALETAGLAILSALSDGRLADAANPWRHLVMLDSNLPETLLRDLAGGAMFARADLRLAAASPDKAVRLKAFLWHGRATFYLNLAEAAALSGQTHADTAGAAACLRSIGVARAIVTDGPRAATQLWGEHLASLHPPTVAVTRITGAGDAMMAAHIAAETRGLAAADAFAAAIEAAARHISEGEQD